MSPTSPTTAPAAPDGTAAARGLPPADEPGGPEITAAPTDPFPQAGPEMDAQAHLLSWANRAASRAVAGTTPGGAWPPSKDLAELTEAQVRAAELVLNRLRDGVDIDRLAALICAAAAQTGVSGNARDLDLVGGRLIGRWMRWAAGMKRPEHSEGRLLAELLGRGWRARELHLDLDRVAASRLAHPEILMSSEQILSRGVPVTAMSANQALQRLRSGLRNPGRSGAAARCRPI